MFSTLFYTFFFDTCYAQKRKEEDLRFKMKCRLTHNSFYSLSNQRLEMHPFKMGLKFSQNGIYVAFDN